MQSSAGTLTLSPKIARTIQSIRDVVGDHSDADIYLVLKESGMNPDEAVQKLLHQDPFHEVKRRKDKKKENTAFKDSLEPRKLTEQRTAFKGPSGPRKVVEQNKVFKGVEPRKYVERNTTFESSAEPKRFTEHGQGMRFHPFVDRNARRTAPIRSSLPGISREFRVVRDNRVNQTTNKETHPASPQSSSSLQVSSNVSVKSRLKIPTDKSHIGSANTESQNSSQSVNKPSDSGRGPLKDTNSSTNRKGVLEETRAKTPNSVSTVQGAKPHSSQALSTSTSSNTLVGLYSSSSDPVHVPSSSRSSGAVGAIRREVGVVGIRRQPSENSAKHSSIPSSSISASLPPKDISSTSEPLHRTNAATKSDQLSQISVPESVVSTTNAGKTFLSHQYGGKQPQQQIGHQKASQHNMEWKPKTSQKSTFISPVVTGATTTPISTPTENSAEAQKEADRLQEKLSRVGVSENEHVFIPEHLRVPEADRTRLTFGSFGLDPNSKRFSSGFQEVGDQQDFGSSSFRAASAANEHVNQDLPNGEVGNSETSSPASTVNSGSASPVSGATSEDASPDKKESLSPRNSESYADIGMVRNNTLSYTPAEPQQQQDTPLPNFTAYDPQTAYDMSFYRPLADESARIQSVPSPVEVMSSHVANNIPASSVAMVQQQAVPQLYPQVHVSHFPNYMPYRQFISPVYMPPMGVPGYSNNPAYPHPSNGSSYLLMPGASSHVAAGGLKYGASQFKPIPAGTPTGFGNYSNPNGYGFTTQGTAGGAAGLEDSSRMKYKEGNLYIPNPQAENSEIWIQAPREIPGLQSAPYYNIPGQPPHPAYLPSHTGHASFNGAPTAQPAHMQFPGLYHPTQQATMATPHHMVPNMGSNVAPAAAGPPGAQLGAYQQPQIGHLNWNTNF